MALLLGGTGAASYAADSGSPRAEVQKNFDQLVKNKSCPGCDLAGAVLNRLDLRRANLEGANLAGARIQLADLSHSNLRNANLQGARLGGTDFAEADLRGANLTGAVLEGAFLTTALLEGDIITRSPDEEDAFAGTGEKVYVPAESAGKPLPYTEEVSVGARMDLESPPPEVQPEKDSETSVLPDSEDTTDEIVSHAEEDPISAGAAIQPVADGRAKQITPIADLEITEEMIASRQEKLQTGPQDTIVLPGEIKGTAVSSGAEVKAAGRKEIVETGVVIEDGLPELEDDKKRKPGLPEQVQSGGAATVAVVQKGPAFEEVQTSELSAATSEQPVEHESPLTEDMEKQEEALIAPIEPMEPAAELPPQEAPDVEQTSIEQPELSETEAGAEVSVLPESVDQGMMYSVQTPSEASAEKENRIKRMLDEKRCVACDFAGTDLSDKRLKGFDLERSNFSGGKLVDADFRDANLKGADFSGADLRNVDFSRADLYRADFSGADLTGAKLQGALKDSAVFSGAVGFSSESDTETE